MQQMMHTPPGLELTRQDGPLAVTFTLRARSAGRALGLLALGGAGTSLGLLVLVAMVARVHAGALPAIILLVPLVVLLSMLTLLFGGLIELLNRTVALIGPAQVVIRTRPFGLGDAASLPLAQVASVEVRDLHLPSVLPFVTKRHRLVAVDATGSTRALPILFDAGEEDTARYVADAMTSAIASVRDDARASPFRA